MQAGQVVPELPKKMFFRSLQDCGPLDSAIALAEAVRYDYDTEVSFPKGFEANSSEFPKTARMLLRGHANGPLGVILMGESETAPAHLGVLKDGWATAYASAAGASFEFEHTLTAGAAADVAEHGLAGLAKLGLNIPELEGGTGGTVQGLQSTAPVAGAAAAEVSKQQQRLASLTARPHSTDDPVCIEAGVSTQLHVDCVETQPFAIGLRPASSTLTCGFTSSAATAPAAATSGFSGLSSFASGAFGVPAVPPSVRRGNKPSAGFGFGSASAYDNWKHRHCAMSFATATPRVNGSARGALPMTSRASSSKPNMFRDDDDTGSAAESIKLNFDSSEEHTGSLLTLLHS
eukprot:3506-Heterococcus_DN1.PRE.5